MIPKKIKVAGHYYDIIWDNEGLSNKNLVGEADHSKNIIFLATKYKGKKINKTNIEETLLHEILHAVDANYNGGGLREDDVSRLSVGLYQVLKDNKFL
ncbi:MAG: hypothetical protein E3J83_03370 [Candidatus Atribacteria bacterium]|nr:MAG: hypothetical protein E3J83_03370 [Candidatus Atribacteria bacterium]